MLGNHDQHTKLCKHHLTLATNTWLVIFAASIPRSCSSCKLKSFDIVAAFPSKPSGWVDICDTGPIPVAGRLADDTPGFSLPPEWMRLKTSSSFSWKIQCNRQEDNAGHLKDPPEMQTLRDEINDT